MMVCPFTGEHYKGLMVKGTCDDCDVSVTYEEDAYGQNFLVLCSPCGERWDEEPDDMGFLALLDNDDPIFRDDFVEPDPPQLP